MVKIVEDEFKPVDLWLLDAIPEQLRELTEDDELYIHGNKIGNKYMIGRNQIIQIGDESIWFYDRGFAKELRFSEIKRCVIVKKDKPKWYFNEKYSFIELFGFAVFCMMIIALGIYILL